MPDKQEPHPYLACDEWTRRAAKHDARARTRGDVIANDLEGRTVYPRYIRRAAGAYVWDVDNNRYIDYLLGYGPVVLGHADPHITAAITAELARGNCIAPLWSTRQVELSELLASTIPGADLAYALKTGSDANSAAVRLARIYTGRDKVIRWGYNGWHDWAAGVPAGIPAATRADTILFDFPDLASLHALFEAHPNEVACVLTMPFEEDVIPSGHLQAIRDIAHKYGALLILDEMRSGFRIRLGGAQEYFGVVADVSAFSKAMANGHTISAVVGRADILDCLAHTRISSTFYADPVAMVAALTTIQILRDTDVIDRLWTLGGALQDGLRSLITEFGIPAEVVGYPPIPFLRFTDANPEVRDRCKRVFFLETTRRGVLFHPDHQWFVSGAHTPQDVEQTLTVCRDAFAATGT